MKPLALLGLACTLMLCACHKQPLLHKLTEQQANEVIAVLQVHNVSAIKEDQGKSGFAINVDDTDLPAAVDLLHKFDLPPAPRLQIGQLFPSDALVASPQAERARLLSGIEQRLEQSLATLTNISTARVQVSYPVGTDLDSAKPLPMHASVLLTYHNQVNADLIVSEVKRFVKNSFTDIDYDNISVILHPAPDLYSGPTTDPSASTPGAWRYWLLPVPLLLSVGAAGYFGYERRRRMQPHNRQAADGAANNARPDIASETPPPARLTPLPAVEQGHGDAA
ncbi:hypothetical protein WJ69_34185 [Burkholderia ubonensis]|uniref:type III secretion system inner membrane ring lipoprotein SctJ n=1 Tax=Burkholderia ubonensis TaxID=101571 RepID=UPI000759046B|nr:type III secretion inner membrane ring lipoprotein SctJ [Burkholderia ubonensis]KVN98508.1 hypothetical protein WJ69_34185 [Burkholderia ubonensis]